MFRKIPKKFLFAMLMGALSQTTQLKAMDEPTDQQIKVAEHAFHEQEQHRFTYEESTQFLSTFHKESRTTFSQGMNLLKTGDNRGEKSIYSVFEFLQKRNTAHFAELKRFEKAAEKGDPDNTYFLNIGLKAQTIQTNINAQRMMLIIMAHDTPDSQNLLKKCYAVLTAQEKEYHNYIR